MCSTYPAHRFHPRSQWPRGWEEDSNNRDEGQDQGLRTANRFNSFPCSRVTGTFSSASVTLTRFQDSSFQEPAVLQSSAIGNRQPSTRRLQANYEYQFPKVNISACLKYCSGLVLRIFSVLIYVSLLLTTQSRRQVLAVKRWCHYTLLVLFCQMGNLQLYLLPVSVSMFFYSLWNMSPMAVILLLTAIFEIATICLLRVANVLSLWSPRH